MAKQVQIKLDEIPDGWSLDAADLINKVSNLKKNYFLIKKNNLSKFYFKKLKN